MAPQTTRPRVDPGARTSAPATAADHRLLVGRSSSRTASPARAEDQGMLTVSTVLGKDKSHGSPDGKATGRPGARTSAPATRALLVIDYSLYFPLSECFKCKCRWTRPQPHHPLRHNHAPLRARRRPAPLSWRAARPRAEPPSSYVCTCNQGSLGHRQPAGRPSDCFDGTCQGPAHDHVQLRARRGLVPWLRSRQGHGPMQELARLHLQRWLGDRLLAGHPPSRTTSTARAEDLGILKLSSVLSSDQPHDFANGEATGRAPSLYICTYNGGSLDHR